MTTGLATRLVGKPVKKNQHVRQKTGGTVAQQLPEYLLSDQVEALMKQAPNAQAEVLMLTQWRAGLRISEALGLEVGDLDFADDGDNVTLRVRRGKGNKPRFVPLHPELVLPSGCTFAWEISGGVRCSLPPDRRPGDGCRVV